METRTITVKGAREHNLRNVSLKLPRGKLICFTGVSGSGKSSFAFDTLFAEGQRRYLESLSSYARQFLGQLAKPDVDHITGLSPAIAIQQKTSGWNPRSTVGTITQIHDYLRVLFARVGRQHCTRCAQPISAQTQDQIVTRILQLGEGKKVVILAPVVRGQKGEYRDLFDDLLRQGYARARVDGEIVSLSEPPSLGRNLRHNIEIVIDRLTVSASSRARLAEAVENALKRGDGSLIVYQTEPRALARTKSPEPQTSVPKAAPRKSARKKTSPMSAHDLLMSSQYACTTCSISFEPPSPQLFSFNSPTGMCQRCDGLGETFDFDPELLVTDPRKTFLSGAIEPMRMRGRVGKWRRHIYRGVANHVGFDLKTPWGKLPQEARHALLYGLGSQHITFEWKWSGGVWRHGGTFEGIIAELQEKYRKANSTMVRTYYEKYMRRAHCTECHGARLNPQARAVRLADRNLDELCGLSITDARQFFQELELGPTERIIAADVIREIVARLTFLCDVGLEYLTLARTAPTLSGGESQRIRLASQIGAGLVGVLYVLDEPSIGLHARDNQRLLDSLCRLRDMGNTVIVVEHDEQTMRTADEIVDFGPGPGVRGGEVVAHGDMQSVAAAKRSITGRYLRGDESIEIPQQRRPVLTPNDPKRKTTKTTKTPKKATNATKKSKKQRPVSR